MSLEIASIIIDFGLVVLIWMVQLLIYPSSKYYTTQQLYVWHKQYTLAMAIIVIPLMGSQLIIALITLIQTKDISTISHFTLVSLTWLTTMAFFVPLHNKVSNQMASNKTLKRMCTLNWIRVLLWTVIFITSFINLK